MTSGTLLPVPKVLIPCALLLVALVVKFIVTGELHREELGVAVGTGLYAALGYATPPTYKGVKATVAKAIPGKARPKKRRRRSR